MLYYDSFKASGSHPPVYGASYTGKQCPINLRKPFSQDNYVDSATNMGPVYCLCHIYLLYTAGIHCSMCHNPGLSVLIKSPGEQSSSHPAHMSKFSQEEIHGWKYVAG